MNIILHESNHVRKMRFDIIELAHQLGEIEADISAFRQAMYAFEREYQNRLGDLAEAVVVLRAQLGMHDSTESQAVTVTTHLAEEHYQLLRSAYRQAAKMCHPDHLSENYREAGLHLFDALNKAYHLQDLVTVEHILWLLQTGQAFNDNPIVVTDKELLAKRHELLGYMIEQKKDQLASLKMREDYDISNRDNWNILLYDYQTQLEDELAMLRGRANAAHR